MAVGLGVAGAAAEGPSPAALPPVLEATHLPPLLTVRGEPAELRYDVFCSPAGDDGLGADRPCDATGTVFARPGTSGPFQPLPLRVDPSAAGGRYVVSVPQALAQARQGFTYYANFRSAAGGEIELPAGGAAAPDQSVPLDHAVEIRLGPHVFGNTRQPDAVVARAAWGDGADEVGLEQGRNLTPIGGSSFDVDEAGNVFVLDEAHKRLLRWPAGGRTPSSTPLAVDGTLADLAVAPDGTVYVLESASAAHGPVLRELAADGSAIASAASAERASALRLGPQGPVLLEQPSNQWTEAAAAGRLLPPDAQRSTGRAGRPLRGGGSVVLLRHDDEIRVALTSSHGVSRAWRVTSDTPLAEVQLAQPLGNGLVLVARVYTDDRDEFVVLVLGSNGLVRSFSLDAADWAETSPLARFRLVGPSLYRLGSAPSGLFVDRFDLEAR